MSIQCFRNITGSFGKRYELFYLDLSYGGGAEKTEYLEQRAEEFLNLNLKPGKVKALETWDYARATDRTRRGVL